MKYARMFLVAPLILCGIVATAKDANDQEFVTKAGQGGLAEVELGQVAADRGSAADVKTFGQRMVTDHSKANDELKAAASKAGANVPSEPSAAQKKMATEMKQKSGADFDRAYSKQMVKDHKEDVALFQKEATSGKNADIKAFAQKTLPTLESHLKMAESLGSAK